MTTKYRNVRTTVDGISFASKAEARRYQELRLLERAKKIGLLMRQIPYDLDVNGIHVCKYVADFAYDDFDRGVTVVEDVKGVETPEFKIKRKLMKAIRGIDIELVRYR